MQYPFDDLSEPVKLGLGRFLDAAREACGPDLVSAVLFGSAAEGRLRPSSDVNLILILQDFRLSRIDGLREPMRLAHAAFRLEAMFLLEEEIPSAAEAFSAKFADIQGRRRVLFGPDPFARLVIPRAAALQRLRQSLLNLLLRLRERYVLVSLREEQLVAVLADAAGPVRSAAATLLMLEGKGEFHPKEALQELSTRLPGGPWTKLLTDLSAAREGRDFPHGEAAASLASLIGLVKALHAHAAGMQ